MADLNTVVEGPTQTAKAGAAERWHSRPIVAALIRWSAIIAPIAISMSVSFGLSQAFPPYRVGVPIAVWWFGIALIGLVTMIGTDKIARRFLPIAALFTLSVVFPDEAPSRFKGALKSGTTAQLSKRLKHHREHGHFDETDSYAEYLLDLAKAVTLHDRLTRGHSERVRAYSSLIAEEMGISTEDREKLHWASLLHDVGKLDVPSEILNKVGKPNEEEWEILKSHPAAAVAYLEPLRPWLGDWLKAADEHHLRWDGNGYPTKAGGTDISLAGRIVAVADAYDVMTSTRSYKKAMSAADARAEVARCSGSQFDPVVTRAFLNLGLGKLRISTGPLAWLGHTFGLETISIGTSVAPVTGLATATARAVIGVTAAVAVPVIVDADIESPPAAVAFADDADTSGVGSLTVTVTQSPSTTAVAPTTSTTATSTTTVAPTTSTTTSTTIAVLSFVGEFINDLQPETTALLTNSPPTTTAPLVATTVVASTSTTPPTTTAAPTPPTAAPATTTSVFTPPPTDGSTSTTTTTTAVPTTTAAPAAAAIIASNIPPMASDDTGAVTFGQSTTLDVITNDFDTDGSLVASTLSIDTAPTNGNVIIEADWRVTYTPTVDALAVDSFDYSICDDGAPQECATATVAITVTPRPAVGDENFIAIYLQAITPITAQVGGGTAPYSFALSPDGDALPSGLTFNVADGTISGAINNIAELDQEFAIEVDVTDATGATGSAIFTVTTVQYEISPLFGQLVISEILPRQGFSMSGEFVELDNLTGTDISLAGMRLLNFNPLMGSANPPQNQLDEVLAAGTVTPTGHATIWLQEIAGSAVPGPEDFVTELHSDCDDTLFACVLDLVIIQIPFTDNWELLRDSGDDVLLLDAQGRLVDFVSYGASSSVDIVPTSTVLIWDPSYQASRGNVGLFNVVSISLASHDAFGMNESRCYEFTGSSGSSSASLGCPGAQTTQVTNTVTTPGEFGLNSQRRTNIHEPEFP